MAGSSLLISAVLGMWPEIISVRNFYGEFYYFFGFVIYPLIEIEIKILMDGKNDVLDYHRY
jgi:hypothetical protein